jgi:transcriptional regulator with XRE-family HTH domain
MGLNKADLARRSGLEASSISRIESGEIVAPSVDALAKLAQALNVTVDVLIHGEQPTVDTTELRHIVATTLGPDNAEMVETAVNLLADKPARDRDVVLRVVLDLIRTFPPLSPDRTKTES